MTPEPEPWHRPRSSLGAAVRRPSTQAVLQDLVASSPSDGELAAGAEHERGPARASGGGRHRITQPAETGPRSRPDSSFDATAITSRIRHGDPLHRRGLRWLHALISGSRESIRLNELATALHRPVTTGRRIAVVSARGGAGKTTVALLVASVLAARRDDPVLAVDADPHVGSLLWRAGVRSDEVEPNVAEQLLSGDLTDRQQLESLLPRTSAGLWVLGGRHLEADGQPAATSDDTVALAMRAVGRFFGVTVLDCGDDLIEWAAASSVIDAAHAAVLIGSATVDGVRAMHVALDGWAQHLGSPVANSVVALVSHTPTTEGVDVKAAARALSAYGPQVVHIPYDRHLAAGAPIDVRRISEPTLIAAVELAGLALALAVDR